MRGWLRSGVTIAIGCLPVLWCLAAPKQAHFTCRPETHPRAAVALQSIVFSSPNTNTLFSGITVRVNFLLTGALR